MAFNAYQELSVRRSPADQFPGDDEVPLLAFSRRAHVFFRRRPGGRFQGQVGVRVLQVELGDSLAVVSEKYGAS